MCVDVGALAPYSYGLPLAGTSRHNQRRVKTQPTNYFLFEGEMELHQWNSTGGCYALRKVCAAATILRSAGIRVASIFCLCLNEHNLRPHTVEHK